MAKADDATPATGPAADLTPEPALLGATDEQFRLMVEQVKEYAIFMIDPQGRISSWNAGAERIEGYRAEEIIGKHFSAFYTKEDLKSGVPQRDLDIARSHGSVDQEGWRLRKDGSRFWASITITALHDEAGGPTGFGEVLRDVTQRRNAQDALQKSRNMFERLFENAPDAVVLVDSHGVIRKVNQQAEALFGYMREEMVGHRVERLMPERFHKRHRQHRSSYFADPRARKMGIGLELYGRNRDGGEIPVDIMLNPIETSEGVWAFAVIRDITQQKETDAKITDLNTALKNQIEQMAGTNRELEAFSYSVSHDLRAPLRHIIGFADLLNAKEDLTPEKSVHYLQVITQAAQKMGNLIDDLLSFSRMGRAEMMKTRIDFGLLVNNIVSDLAEDAKEREIEWEIAPLPAVIGDAAMLRQVMVNLIANAVKFTRPRPRAKIEIGTLDDSPTETLFYVRDNGVGFDIRYVNKLFNLFQRLHSPEDFEGTGVGLANVQRIIQRHGGRVWAEGTLDGGATFWFTLPKANPGEEAPR